MAAVCTILTGTICLLGVWLYRKANTLHRQGRDRMLANLGKSQIALLCPETWEHAQ